MLFQATQKRPALGSLARGLRQGIIDLLLIILIAKRIIGEHIVEIRTFLCYNIIGATITVGGWPFVIKY